MTKQQRVFWCPVCIKETTHTIEVKTKKQDMYLCNDCRAVKYVN